jgi:hypothetical protein
VARVLLLHHLELLLVGVVQQRPAEVVRGLGLFGLLPLAGEAVPFEFEELMRGLVRLLRSGLGVTMV